MTYARVIPRDLFNEANLLKCYGRLWCLLDETRGHNARLGLDPAANDGEDYSGAPFDVQQEISDGGISIANIPFRVGGTLYRLYVPLNNRRAWPLWCEAFDQEGVPEFCERVFDDDGHLSPQFFALITGLRS